MQWTTHLPAPALVITVARLAEQDVAFLQRDDGVEGGIEARDVIQAGVHELDARHPARLQCTRERGSVHQEQFRHGALHRHDYSLRPCTTRAYRSMVAVSRFATSG